MNRGITQTHINAYKQGGKLNNLFKAIKEDPEISFEIRRNNEVMVYYHKDKILTMSVDDKGGIKKFELLSAKYYKNSTVYKIDENCSLSEAGKYFKEAKTLVYKYKMGAEFTVQQNITLGNNSFDNRFFVVDMEWQFPQSDIKKEDRISKTRIDLIIVDTKPNKEGFNDIYLAELKVGTSATEGSSGVEPHINKTKAILDLQAAVDILKEDVQTIIAQKSELGLIEGSIKPLKFSDKPKMMLIMAYRNSQEKADLEQKCEDAKKRAQAIGMEEPLCLMKDARMVL